MDRDLDKLAATLLKDMMRNCRAERKSKTELSNRRLAAQLSITENYICALESARAQPSVQVLLKYLLASGFNVSPLRQLAIDEAAGTPDKQNNERANLIRKIYSFNDAQVDYLLEQARVAEIFDLRVKLVREGKIT